MRVRPASVYCMLQSDAYSIRRIARNRDNVCTGDVSVVLYGRHGVTVSNVGRINEVNQLRVRLVLGLVTIFGWVNHLGM